MRKVWLDHAAPPQRKAVGPLLLVASGAIAALMTGLAVYQVHARSSALESDISRLQSPYRPSSGNRAATATQQEEMAGARQAMEELALPWEPLFKAVEHSRHNEVQLLVLDPDAKRHRLRITAEAAGAEAMLAYVRQLGMQPMLHKVFLLQHEPGDQSESAVRFSVEAEWAWRS